MGTQRGGMARMRQAAPMRGAERVSPGMYRTAGGDVVTQQALAQRQALELARRFANQPPTGGGLQGPAGEMTPGAPHGKRTIEQALADYGPDAAARAPAPMEPALPGAPHGKRTVEQALADYGPDAVPGSRPMDLHPPMRPSPGLSRPGMGGQMGAGRGPMPPRYTGAQPGALPPGVGRPQALQPGQTWNPPAGMTNSPLAVNPNQAGNMANALAGGHGMSIFRRPTGQVMIPKVA